MVDNSARNREVACSIHAIPTTKRVPSVVVCTVDCGSTSPSSILGVPSTLLPADRARCLLSRRMRVRLAPRAPRFVMRLVSQFLCLRNETSSILVRGADRSEQKLHVGFQIQTALARYQPDLPRGWTQKAAGFSCKEADSERYRASPLRLARAARWPCTSL